MNMYIGNCMLRILAHDQRREVYRLDRENHANCDHGRKMHRRGKLNQQQKKTKIESR
jgi:hypothetical protein